MVAIVSEETCLSHLIYLWHNVLSASSLVVVTMERYAGPLKGHLHLRWILFLCISNGSNGSVTVRNYTNLCHLALLSGTLWNENAWGRRSNGSALIVLTDRQTHGSDSMTSTGDAGGNESVVVTGKCPFHGHPFYVVLLAKIFWLTYRWSLTM